MLGVWCRLTYLIDRQWWLDPDNTQTGREMPENRRKKSQENYRDARNEFTSVPTSVSTMVIWDR